MATSYIEIPAIEDMADNMGVAAEEFVEMINGVASSFPSLKPKYNRRSQTWRAAGPVADLKAFANALDEEIMGGAQSISDEDSAQQFIVEA